MTIDKKRVGLAIAIFAGAVLLHGCASTEAQDVTDSPAPTATAIVETDDVSETVRIINRLDAAGCDFAGVDIIRGQVRKYHNEIHVSCRENPAVVY